MVLTGNGLGDKLKVFVVKLFTSQQTKYLQPVLTPLLSAVLFGGSFILLTLVTIFLFILSGAQNSVSVRYDNQCTFGDNACQISVTLDEDMKKPVYLHYEVKGMYQNHKRYYSSISDSQLNGDDPSMSSLKSDCYPLTPTCTKLSATCPPCGLVATSEYNDTISIEDPSSTAVLIKTDGIAWSTDVNSRITENYKPNDANRERGIAWLRTSGLMGHTRKTYGYVDADMPAGTYKFEISNTYPVAAFKGEKHLTLSTVSTVGIFGIGLPILFLFSALLCGMAALAILGMIGTRIGVQKWRETKKE